MNEAQHMLADGTLQQPAQEDEAAVAAHHAAGRLTARERVTQLLDAGTFVEVDAYATQAMW